MNIAIVTGNQTKFLAMQTVLAHYQLSVDQVDLAIDEIQDLDPRRVVTAKVLAAFAAVGRPVLVDDSGIYFEKYNNFPGIFSKLLYQAINFDGIFKLVEPGDPASFRCLVAYLDASLTTPMIFEGVTHGSIVSGDVDLTRVYEMPYASIFKADDSSMAMDQMASLEQAYDHRRQAVNQFAEWYLSKHTSV